MARCRFLGDLKKHGMFSYASATRTTFLLFFSCFFCPSVGFICGWGFGGWFCILTERCMAWHYGQNYSLEFFLPSSFGRWMAKRDSHKDTQRSDFGHGGCFSFVFFLTIMGWGARF